MDRDVKKDYLDIARHVAGKALPAHDARLRALAFLRHCLAEPERAAGAGADPDPATPSRRDPRPAADNGR